jgi:hypothetical protein
MFVWLPRLLDIKPMGEVEVPTQLNAVEIVVVVENCSKAPAEIATDANVLLPVTL